jgi:hypothetical protein
VFYSVRRRDGVLCLVKRLVTYSSPRRDVLHVFDDRAGITNWIRFGIWLLVGIRFYRYMDS